MKNTIILICFAAFFVISDSFAQTNDADLKKIIPMDPRIKTGTLKNGITYFIMKNSKPEKRAELRLAVNAGSIEEDDDQQGLAHFTEHMAFSGTEHFKRHELTDYLESQGVKFGADLNAYTSFDETVYMLQVPTDSTDVFNKGFLVLEDWAKGQLFDTAEAARERHVVIEEWRLGKGADERMRQKIYPLLYKDSRYAERLPIGKKALLDTFAVETAKRFYKDWYRPELMAVVAVGDFDVNEVEKQIIKHFSDIPASKNPRPLVAAPVPDHKETIIAKATDKEASYTRVELEYKHPMQENQTYDDYRKTLAQHLFTGMLNSRLQELTLQPDPPFSTAYNYYGEIARTKNAYVVAAYPKDKNIERSVAILLTELERVRRYGFTATEMEREKKEMLRDEENAYNERDKSESNHYVYGIVDYYLSKNNRRDISSVDFDYDFYKKYLPGVSLDEVNALSGKWVTQGENMVIVITAPDKEGVVLPGDDKLLALVKQQRTATIEPYKDIVIDKPLLSQMPVPGNIVAEKKIETLHITEWTLSNGAKVVLKPTDFKNDEIQFSGFAWGGSSLYPDKDAISAGNAPQLLSECGTGPFNKVQFGKYMQGKIAQHYSWIGETEEGVGGTASPQDFETLLQENYLCFTAPRKDSAGYASYISTQQSFLENQGLRPEKAFYDTMNVTMSQYHYRRRPYTIETLKEIDMETAYKIYRERLSDAGNFTFIIVGSFKPETIKPLVEKYIASLPSTGKNETWKDVGVRYQKGKIEKTVYRGQEPKSSVSLNFSGDYEWNKKNNMTVDFLMELMRIKLRENLREEKGSVYGVGAYAQRQRIPVQTCRMMVSFGCDPQKVDSLVAAAFQEINKIKSYTPSEEDMNKVKELMKRQHETSVQENRYWLTTIQQHYEFGENMLDVLDYNKLVDEVTPVQLTDAANKYFNMDNFAQFVLKPEK